MNRVAANVALATALLAGTFVPLGGAQAASYFQNFNDLGFAGVPYNSAPGDSSNEKYSDPTVAFTQAVDHAGWTFSGIGNPGSTFFQAFNATGTFSDGAILLNENGPGTASYTMTGLAPNSQFKLSFLVYGDNRPRGQWGLDVSVNGGAPVNFGGVIGAPGSNPGTTETISAFADNLGSAILLFAQTGSVGEGSPIIDDVAISQTPLPSTWLMLLSGFVGLGFFAYRGKRNRSAAIAAA